MALDAALGKSLSEQETLALGLAAEGLSDRRIADRLSVSENTIKTHLRRCYQKLGANNRAHAVHLAFRGDAVTPARLVNIRRIVAAYVGIRRNAPPGSHLARLHDLLVAALDAEQ